ncbi:hypothetical protein [Micromonospora sp. RTGN7]|uniref:hypothetical protein n=1 Tax=Micromonospora sp. RTGN7 TaxID=3016526 RepID=UPI0029FF1143|nr:hypothetical protein [Micromonospora sp. RTGN7]
MSGDVDSGALRELMVVLAVAGVGLLLAMVAAFSPWHPTPSGRTPAGVVGLHHPGGMGSDPIGSVVEVTDGSAG